jgi:hypothetical protein
MGESNAEIWRKGLYVSLLVVAVGLILTATPFLTTALDTGEGRVAFAEGQAGIKSVRAENVSLESSPFKYYIVIAKPYTLPYPGLRTGLINLYLYPNQLVYTSALFDYPSGGTSQRAIMIRVPSSGVYVMEADVIGLYWRDSDRLDVEVTSMSRPLLIIGPVIATIGVVILAVMLITLKRHRRNTQKEAIFRSYNVYFDGILPMVVLCNLYGLKNSPHKRCCCLFTCFWQQHK